MAGQTHPTMRVFKRNQNLTVNIRVVGCVSGTMNAMNTQKGRYSVVDPEDRAARAEKAMRLLAAIILTCEPVTAGDMREWGDATWRTLASTARVPPPSPTTRRMLIELLTDVGRGGS
jgi:hypothetical protein